MRAFNAGVVDDLDYIIIAYGGKGLTGINQLCGMNWIDQNGNQNPILGLFDLECSNQISELDRKRRELVRKRIHALGFINERKYEEGEFLKELRVFLTLIYSK